MKYNFTNYAKHIGARGKNEWYKWRLFLDEPEDTLKKIDKIEYRLHESFPEPIRIIDNRDSKFALNSLGWGSFLVHITLYFNDGTEDYDSYLLKLSNIWPPDVD